MNFTPPKIPPFPKIKEKMNKEKSKKEYLDELLSKTFKKEYFNR